ncbi:M15 family metallopeptidase [Mariniradius sediminis]|uniref:M15 family metallopeptidase n=1 Tax=Mariniradius sediminis TaxID=2909237 RepID=A0ABS9BXG9_9BACT|nr:M15 family metallopeptidase [Mariniradius sediminis]MCF1752340.1 M15 family metallopeptidase [Mariniradius sediminis]
MKSPFQNFQEDGKGLSFDLEKQGNLERFTPFSKLSEKESIDQDQDVKIFDFIPKIDIPKTYSNLLDIFTYQFQYSPICFKEVATPGFPPSIRVKVDEIEINHERIKSLITRNRESLNKFKINPLDVVTDLKRYVDFNIIERRISEFNNKNLDRIEINKDEVINSIFVIAVLEFQKKIVSKKLNELKNSKEIDGIIGEKTLCSLGIIEFKNRSQKLNPLKSIIDTIKKREIQIQIGTKKCDHTNWNEFTFNTYFLGLSFNLPVHYTLVKQLRLAEDYLINLDRFKNKTISQISDELGICHKDNQDHKGGRRRIGSNSMHNYGLALDVNYHGNPWIIGQEPRLPVNPKPGEKNFLEKKKLYDEAYERLLKHIQTSRRLLSLLKKCSAKVGKNINFYGATSIADLLRKSAIKNNGNTNLIFDQIYLLNDLFKIYLKEIETKEQTFWRGHSSFKSGNRNPLNGFLNLDKDLVYSLRSVANLCWGAIDFGKDNGDIMHFDARTIFPYGKLTVHIPNETHPNFINTENQKEFELEIKNGQNNLNIKYLSGTSFIVPIKLGKNLPFKTGVFLPTNYKRTPFVDLVIYLHGHMDKYSPEKFKKEGIEFYWENYSKIKEFFEHSRGNAILLAPTLGLVSSKEFGDLGKPYGLDTYVSSCVDQLRQRNLIPIHSFPFRIILAAHSGGGKPLGEILNQENKLLKNVSEVWGFDCLYGDSKNGRWVNNYAKWLSSKTELNLKRYFFHFSATPTPTRAGINLENRFPDNVVNIYLKNTNHRTVIETAWKNYINKYPLFEPLKKFAAWNPKKVKEYFEVSIDFYDSNGADSREFQENETNDSGFENSDQDDLGFIHQFEENPFSENFTSNELENEFNHQKAIGLNRKYSQNLGWGAYQEQINEILLPYSGMEKVSLGEEAFVKALARWKGENGLQPDGVLGPKTWGILKQILRLPKDPLISTPSPINPNHRFDKNPFEFNKWYADKVIQAMDQGIVGSNFNSKRQLEEISKGNRIFNINPQESLIQILPIIEHIATNAWKQNFHEIVIGSFIRNIGNNGKCTGHCLGRSIDINYRQGGFNTPGALEMVINILDYLMTLPSSYRKGIYLGLPFQGRFFGKQDLPKFKSTSSSNLIDSRLKELIPQLGGVFPDNDDHLHIQVLWDTNNRK